MLNFIVFLIMATKITTADIMRRTTTTTITQYYMCSLKGKVCARTDTNKSCHLCDSIFFLYQKVSYYVNTHTPAYEIDFGNICYSKQSMEGRDNKDMKMQYDSYLHSTASVCLAVHR